MKSIEQRLRQRRAYLRRYNQLVAHVRENQLTTLMEAARAMAPSWGLTPWSARVTIHAMLKRWLVPCVLLTPIEKGERHLRFVDYEHWQQERRRNAIERMKK